MDNHSKAPSDIAESEDLSLSLELDGRQRTSHLILIWELTANLR